MDAAELREWAAFYELEPWGTEVDDLLNAQVCQIIAVANTPKGKPLPKLEQFLLFPDKPAKRKQTVEEMHFRFKMIAAAMENSRRK